MKLKFGVSLLSKKMGRKKIEDYKIEEEIFFIVDTSVFPLTIREVVKRLENEFDRKVSPQVIKRKLLKLKKEGKIN